MNPFEFPWRLAGLQWKSQGIIFHTREESLLYPSGLKDKGLGFQ